MISSIGSQASAFVNKVPTKIGDKNQVKKTDEVLANDRVSTLSKQIKNGEYKVDVPKTSQAVAKELTS